MSLFSFSKCLSVTWDAKGRCKALLAEKHGAGLKVVGTWTGEAKGKQALAEVVREAVRELSVTADAAVVIGGNASEVATFDVRLPKMSAEDMRGAIEFRLGAQVPMGTDDVFWGYRVTDRSVDQLTARVAYVRRDCWDQWLEAANGSPVGVDVVMPPQAAIDPVCGDRSVCLGQGVDDESFFLLEPGDLGVRKVRLAGAGVAVDGAFGAPGEEPLAMANFELGVLAGKSAAEQREFAGAVLLAAYGLSDAMAADRGYWPSVPAEMRPRRNRMLKYWTAGVAIYLVFILTLLITSHFHRNHVRLKRVQKDTNRLTALTKQLQSEIMAEDPGTVLAQEFDEVGPARISMVKTLAHLSALTPDQLWLTNFTWDYNGGYQVRLELRGNQDEGDLIQQLRQTPLLSGLQAKKTLNPGGQVSYSLSARVVNPDELPVLPPLPKVEKAKVPVDDSEGDVAIPLAPEVDPGDDGDALTPPPPPPPPSFPGTEAP